MKISTVYYLLFYFVKLINTLTTFWVTQFFININSTYDRSCSHLVLLLYGCSIMYINDIWSTSLVFSQTWHSLVKVLHSLFLFIFIESNDKNAFVFLLMILFVHVCLYDLLISVQMKLYNKNESLRIWIIDYSDKDVTVDKENLNNFTLANVIFKAIKCSLFKSIVEFLLWDRKYTTHMLLCSVKNINIL